MKNVSHKKVWGADTNPAHVEPPQIPLVKEIYTGKSDVDYVKLKLRRDPTSSTSYIYEFIMSLFDHCCPKEFPLFMQNFQMNLAVTGTTETEGKVKYIRLFVLGEASR